MPIVINSCEVIADEWRRLDDTASITDTYSIIVSAARLSNDWRLLQHARCRLGVELSVIDLVEDIGTMLPRLDLVVLNFEAFADGRAFSQARLLRERYSFVGDIRAQGEVLRDQLAFMRRCGISQFSLLDDEDVAQALGAFGDISQNYQPALRPQGYASRC